MSDHRSPGNRPAVSPELDGDLLCRRCRYNLKGLSIRAVCPECSLPVRATLLAVVDPRANEIQPLHLPRITAVGLILWTHAAIVNAALVAFARGHAMGLKVNVSSDFARVAPWFAAAAGLGSLVLVAPHGGLSLRDRLAATIGTVCILSVAAAQWKLLVVLDRISPWISYDQPPSWDRLKWKLAADVALAVAMLALRPNARQLAARSLLMRTGMVNRQTLAALAAVAGICVLGDLLLVGARALGGSPGLASGLLWSGQLMLLFGGALMIIGLIGAAVDAWRLLPVVLEKPLHLDDLLARENRQ
ncbi:MAG: hypothetical protein ACOYN0_07410 [Phycisphaerales bacterium]